MPEQDAVFVSYSAGDKATADAICAKLEGEKIRVWMAPRDILPSADWEESIAAAIRKCRAMVVVFSSKANLSHNIKREVGLAISEEKPVVPFRIEDVQPAGALEYQLGTVHWLDAIAPPLELHLARLVETVSAILGKPAVSVPSPPARDPPRRELYTSTAVPPPPPPRAVKKRYGLMIGLAAGAVILVAAIISAVGERPQPREHPPVALLGVWSGTYSCNVQNATRVSFNIFKRGPGHADATVSFEREEGGERVPAGRYRAHVNYEPSANPAFGPITFRFEEGLQQPPGIVPSGFSGTADLQKGIIQGHPEMQGCYEFRVSRE